MAKQLNNDILQEFREAMKIGLTEQNQFTEAFQAVFEEALLRDKIVKINGLGTFKLIEVAARKSVDVNTGEEIEIAGHYKLNFIPEIAIKDLVNKPLSHLEPVELGEEETEIDVKEEKTTENVEESNDPLQKLTEQAIELKDMLEDIQGVKKVNTTIEQPSVSREPIKQAQENSPKNINTMNTTNNKPQVNTTQRTNVSTTHSAVSAKSMLNATNKSTPKKKYNYTWVWILVAILLILAIAGILVYLNWDKIESKFKVEEVPEVVAVDTTTVQIEEIVDESIDKTSEIYSDKFSDLFNRKREYTEFIETAVLNEGSRLAWLSYKQYGHSEFWVYIYEANRDIVADPNYILVGTKVRIPKLDKELIDVTNPECIAYAEYLHDFYVRGNK